MSLGNSVNVAVPLYDAGDLCLANSSQVSGATTVLQVGGKVTISNSAHVGASGSNIAEAHIAGAAGWTAARCTTRAAPPTRSTRT
jgi:hypothetical protein